MDRFANDIVPTKTKRDVGDSTAYFRVWQIGFDPTRGVDVVDCVVVMLLHAGGNSEDIGVEDDVFRWKADIFRQDSVRAFANARLILKGGGLALLVERHHNHGCAVLQD